LRFLATSADGWSARWLPTQHHDIPVVIVVSKTMRDAIATIIASSTIKED
jgi:hypothetical protein